MDIGEQKRVIQIEPEPMKRPEFIPEPAVPDPAPAPDPTPVEAEPITVPGGSSSA